MAYLGAAYLWVKAAHVIFVIFLMAGLFMMPRFFVYHQESAPGSDEDRKWIDREKRLLKIILNPSLVLTWIFGLMLMVEIGAWSFGWFHLKLLFVLGLTAYHGWIAGYAKKLAKGQRTLTDRQLRLFNEVPGIAAAVIVIAVIVKPF
ncbi:CopD family protein [Sphingobium xenophagum]|uniref:Protoporphyrinogen IX oxidase n=1 Tax=Sphingobium xenophagum TaxID=121428 RepID=A0A401IX12_SPHXE|nr:CopD family protein [Sphingobium xenophagum]GBH28886.1 membrane protein [Sphingobium xenophagum]